MEDNLTQALKNYDIGRIDVLNAGLYYSKALKYLKRIDTKTLSPDDEKIYHVILKKLDDKCV